MAIDINDFRGLANLAKRNQVDISDFDKNGDTLLARAIQAVSSESAEFLMKQGCPVDTQNKYHETPLHWACTNSCLKIVEMLLQKEDIDISIKNNKGKVALDVVSQDSIKTLMMAKQNSVDKLKACRKRHEKDGVPSISFHVPTSDKTFE